ncbi:aldo/keto reductase [Virgisporangium aurantiacum]|uniref:Oxidoreductase n=1 Tax=Virgisporangium aurantiacum TaxID=175570 RepID=A0A8J3YZP5_9ACTN|nr:aldo/keto reductase [Virgisporangium aurantiacum]GIJ52680.1 oxidoreductase [Virgisporangium aurantiacum]
MTGRLTLGASRLGQRDDGASALARALVRSPIGQIDTSNAYAEGRSESLLGEALRETGASPVVFSKADADPVTGVFDGDRVKRSFEESITRLGVDRLPLYHLHDPYGMSVAEGLRTAVPALVELRSQGLVDAIGIAAGDPALVEEYIRSDMFDAVLTHNRYTLVDRSAEALIAAARERNMTVFNAAPFGGGILAGSPRRRGDYAYRPASPEVLAFVERLAAVCGEYGTPVSAAALHFSLTSGVVDSTVVGVSDAAQVAEIEALAADPIPDGLMEALAALGTPS